MFHTKALTSLFVLTNVDTSVEVTVLPLTSLGFHQYTRGFHKCRLCTTIYLHFSSLFAPDGVSKCEIKYQWLLKVCILKLHSSFLFISNVEPKLSWQYYLSSLYCGKFMKTLNYESDQSIPRLNALRPVLYCRKSFLAFLLCSNSNWVFYKL